MNRKKIGNLAIAALALAVLLTTGSALAQSGWGYVLKNVADRLLPQPAYTAYAQAPAPDAAIGTYQDSTGAGRNYVYRVRAATPDGRTRTLQLISFGKPLEEGDWLKISARGGSAVRYGDISEAEVPGSARSAWGKDGR